jgi:carboxypeptidase C (cathepsin A)
MPRPRLLACLLAAVLAAAPPALTQPAPGGREAPEAREAPQAWTPLPADRTTTHRIELPGRSLEFQATAGSIVIEDASGGPEAEIGYVAYRLAGADPATRPVTFAVNGGPGAASAYLHLGVMGPWLLPMDARRIVPSQSLDLVPNPETWLDFTDLVFVDPVGTGFSRLVEPTDRLRERYLSLEGDIDALADFVLRWLTGNGRVASPKYFVGESYGGFRGPLVAEKLQTDLGVAIDGMALVSPLVDAAWLRHPDHALLPKVAVLPALAAAAMEEAGTFSEAAMRQAEAYAEGAYLADLLQGPGDAAAVGRLVERVSALTGLDPQAVEAAAGRVDGDAFAAEALRDDGRRISAYDATVATVAGPRRARRAPDPVLDAMTAPLTGAALGLYRDRLRWLPDRRYMLLNGGVSGAWDWADGHGQPEVVGSLARTLGLDPELRVLVVHGYTDLVTPYFASELLLRQIAPTDPPGRLRTETYRGGHMFYLREDSRAALREDALWLYEARTG